MRSIPVSQGHGKDVFIIYSNLTSFVLLIILLEVLVNVKR